MLVGAARDVGARSGEAEGGERHPETFLRSSQLPLQQACLAFFLPVCPDLKSKPSLTLRSCSFPWLSGPRLSSIARVFCMALNLALLFQQTGFSPSTSLSFPLAPGLTWAGPDHRDQVSSQPVLGMTTARSLRGA